MNTVIRHGRIIDPANQRDEIADLAIVDGRIADLSAIRNPPSEIDEVDVSNLTDGAQSVILDQVTNGLAIRMAVLYLCGGISTP